MTTTAEKFSTQFVGVIAQLLNDPEKAIAEHGLSRHQAMLAVAFYRAFEAVAFGRYSEIEQHLAQADEHFAEHTERCTSWRRCGLRATRLAAACGST